jgi:Protein of unknown function (DUF1348)
MSEQRPPFPPFDLASALQKVQAAEDAWNTRDPHHVSLSYTEDSVWRNRDQFFTGRKAIVEFLTTNWEHEPESLPAPIGGATADSRGRSQPGAGSRCRFVASLVSTVTLAHRLKCHGRGCCFVLVALLDGKALI